MALDLTNGRTRAQSRRRVRVRAPTLTLAAAAAVEVLVVGLALYILLDWPARFLSIVVAALVPLAATLVLGWSRSVDAIAARLVRPAASLAGLTTLIAGVYVFVVVGLGRPPTHGQRTLLALSLAAAGICALLYGPTRRRLDTLAVRLVHGERETPDAVVRAFGSRLSRAIPLEELLLQLVEILRQSLGFEAAEIWTLRNGALERVVSDPERGASSFRVSGSELSALARSRVVGEGPIAVWLPDLLADREGVAVRVAPVVHGGELFGLIVVEQREESQLDDDVDSALADLARQIGLVLRNVRLDSELQASLAQLQRQAEELRASRARVVAAADGERRRIERDLHDGAQQHLVALEANLGAVRALIEKDPEQAKTILAELRGAVHEAMEEFRDLAHGIFPPLLQDRGLEEALTNAARRAHISTRFETNARGRYDPEIEATVYFCCVEALQNAAKHAGEGARATIRLHTTEEALSFEVADDGSGLDPAHTTFGTGLTNMRDRVEASGGALRIESTLGGGTRVSATIPLVS